MGDREETLQIEYDDISVRRKPILTRFGSTFGKSGFDENESHLIGTINPLMQSMLTAQVFILVSKN